MQILCVLKSIFAAVHRKLGVCLVKKMDVFFFWNRIEWMGILQLGLWRSLFFMVEDRFQCQHLLIVCPCLIQKQQYLNSASMKRAGQCGDQVPQDQWQFGWAMHQVQAGECLLFGILLLVTSLILQIQSLHIQHLPLCKRLVQHLHQNFTSLQCHTSCYVVGFRV